MARSVRKVWVNLLPPAVGDESTPEHTLDSNAAKGTTLKQNSIMPRPKLPEEERKRRRAEAQKKRRQRMDAEAKAKEALRKRKA